MVYNNSAKKAMSLKEYGDKFINNDIAKIMEVDAYLTFFVLSAALEFITRCRMKLPDFHNMTPVGRNYVQTINQLQALAPYRRFNERNGNNMTNNLYKAMRCGLLHASLPNIGIILSGDKNELDNKVVGCKDLYDDIKGAWEEIKNDSQILNYLETTKALIISKTLPKDKKSPSTNNV